MFSELVSHRVYTAQGYEIAQGRDIPVTYLALPYRVDAITRSQIVNHLIRAIWEQKWGPDIVDSVKRDSLVQLEDIVRNLHPDLKEGLLSSNDPRIALGSFCPMTGGSKRALSVSFGYVPISYIRDNEEELAGLNPVTQLKFYRDLLYNPEIMKQGFGLKWTTSVNPDTRGSNHDVYSDDPKVINMAIEVFRLIYDTLLNELDHLLDDTPKNLDFLTMELVKNLKGIRLV
jgi:hypothetical protein